MTPSPKQQQILEALRRKGALSKPCPECGHNSRGVQPEYAGLAFSKTALFEGPRPIATLAIVECPNCGLVTLYNLRTLGVEP
jgi:predicted RNA-binding Zn-ribbon protein involved in translation (DUF1610 family)